MGYSVPKDITTLHNFPRYDALKGMAIVSNTFNPNIKTSAGREYLEGVGSLFGAYVAMAVVLVVIFSTLFVAACCCRRRVCPPRDNSRKRSCLGRSCGLVFLPQLWYLVAVVGMLIGVIYSFTILTKLNTGVTDTINGFKAFNNVLSTANSTIGSTLLPPVSAATGDATDFLTSLQTAVPPAPTELIDAVASISASTLVLSAQLEQVSALLSSATGALGEAVGENGKYPVNQAGPLLFRSGLGVLVGFLVYLCGSLVGLVGKPCGARALRGSLPILLLAVGGVWSFGAVFFAVALAGSDVCVAPGAAVLAILNATDSASASAAYPTAQYYTAPCGTENPSGAYQELLDGRAQANSSIASIIDLNATIIGLGNPALVNLSEPFLVRLTGHFNEANAGIDSTLDAISCPIVYGAFEQVLSGLCGGLIESAVLVWSVATAAGILLVVVAASATSLACRHPGDPDVDEHKALVDDSESYLDTAYGAYPTTTTRKQPASAYRYSTLPASGGDELPRSMRRM